MYSLNQSSLRFFNLKRNFKSSSSTFSSYFQRAYLSSLTEKNENVEEKKKEEEPTFTPEFLNKHFNLPTYEELTSYSNQFLSSPEQLQFEKEESERIKKLKSSSSYSSSLSEIHKELEKDRKDASHLTKSSTPIRISSIIKEKDSNERKKYNAIVDSDLDDDQLDINSHPSQEENSTFAHSNLSRRVLLRSMRGFHNDLYNENNLTPPWLYERQREIMKSRTLSQVRKVVDEINWFNHSDVTAKYIYRLPGWYNSMPKQLKSPELSPFDRKVQSKTVKNKYNLINYGPMESMAYTYVHMPRRVQIMSTILKELRVLADEEIRYQEIQPYEGEEAEIYKKNMIKLKLFDRVLDFGCGPGTTAASLFNVFNKDQDEVKNTSYTSRINPHSKLFKSSGGTSSSASFITSNTEPLPFSYTGVDHSASMRDAAGIMCHGLVGGEVKLLPSLEPIIMKLLQHHENLEENPDLFSSLPLDYHHERYDLITIGWTLSELPSEKARGAAITALYHLLKPGGYIVIVENGDPQGSHIVRSAREGLLGIKREELLYNNKNNDDGKKDNIFSKFSTINKKTKEINEKFHQSKQKNNLENDLYTLNKSLLPPFPFSSKFDEDNEDDEDDVKMMTIAPCTHDKPCPLGKGYFCSMQQRTDNRLHGNLTNTPYSYVIMKKVINDKKFNKKVQTNYFENDEKEKIVTNMKELRDADLNRQWVSSSSRPFLALPPHGVPINDEKLIINRKLNKKIIKKIERDNEDEEVILLSSPRMLLNKIFKEEKIGQNFGDLPFGLKLLQYNFLGYLPAYRREDYSRIIRSPRAGRGHISYQICFDPELAYNKKPEEFDLESLETELKKSKKDEKKRRKIKDIDEDNEELLKEEEKRRNLELKLNNYLWNYKKIHQDGAMISKVTLSKSLLKSLPRSYQGFRKSQWGGLLPLFMLDEGMKELDLQYKDEEDNDYDDDYDDDEIEEFNKEYVDEEEENSISNEFNEELSSYGGLIMKKSRFMYHQLTPEERSKLNLLKKEKKKKMMNEVIDNDYDYDDDEEEEFNFDENNLTEKEKKLLRSELSDENIDENKMEKKFGDAFNDSINFVNDDLFNNKEMEKEMINILNKKREKKRRISQNDAKKLDEDGDEIQLLQKNLEKEINQTEMSQKEKELWNSMQNFLSSIEKNPKNKKIDKILQENNFVEENKANNMLELEKLKEFIREDEEEKLRQEIQSDSTLSSTGRRRRTVAPIIKKKV